jgi:hypothetical protein
LLDRAVEPAAPAAEAPALVEVEPESVQLGLF